MSDYWTIAVKGKSDVSPIRLPENRQIPTIEGKLTEDAQWVAGCEGLLAQRRVGAGRIVMSLFPIDEDVLIKWPSYGSFLMQHCSTSLPGHGMKANLMEICSSRENGTAEKRWQR